MKNAILSIILFLSIMLSVSFLNSSLIKLCDNIKDQTDEIETILLDGNFDKAYSESISLLELIEENYFLTSVYASHQDFDNLINEAVKLSIYTTYKDISESQASLHMMKFNVEHIKKLQIPNLENVL